MNCHADDHPEQHGDHHLDFQHRQIAAGAQPRPGAEGHRHAARGARRLRRPAGAQPARRIEAPGIGKVALDYYAAPGYVFQRNVLIASQSPNAYPAGNFFPASIAAVGFVGYSAGNYRLASGSAYSIDADVKKP